MQALQDKIFYLINLNSYKKNWKVEINYKFYLFPNI